jgi:hypothetical protein
MNLPRTSALFAACVAVTLSVACGGTDPGWIGPPPGAHDSTSSNGGGGTSKDAGADADPGYRDPKKSDAGCVLPNLVCGGACIAVNADHDHCGSCENACIGKDSTCLAGKCSCMGALVDYCDGAGCMDVSSDVNNCGSCGNVCDPNQFDSCVQGVCQQLN